MDVCYGDCGGPVDGQEVIINKACGLYLITAKIRKRERERLYIYMHPILLIEMTQSDSL